MKKLQLFWGENRQNKVITILILLIVLCCILTICTTITGVSAWLLFSDTPATSAHPSYYPTETPPTLIPFPTTIPPTQENTNLEIKYLIQFNENLILYHSLIEQVSILGAAYKENPDLFYDPQWRDSIKEKLDEIDDLTNIIKNNTSAPENFIELQELNIEFANQSELFTKNFRLWLDTGDKQYDEAGSIAGQSVIEIMQAMTAKIEELQNR